MVPDGLFAQERFALEQGILGLFTLRDIADVALDDLLATRQIDVTDEFHLNKLSVFRYKRQILITGVFILLQGLEGFPAGFAILERTNLPELLFHKLFTRISQHVDQEWIDICNHPCHGIQD